MKDFLTHNMLLGEVETSVGTLAVFRYRGKSEIALKKVMGQMIIENISPDAFIRKLIIATSYFAKDVINEEEPETKIASEKLDALTLDDLDAFSSFFLKDGHGEYLYREQIFDSKNEEGKMTITPRWGEVFATRSEDERPFEFLHRLFVLKDKKDKKQRKKAIGSLGLSDSFLRQLDEQSKATSAISKHLEALTPITQSDSFKSISQIAKMTEPLRGMSSFGNMDVPSVIATPIKKIPEIDSIADLIKAENKEKRKREDKALELSERTAQRSDEQLSVLKNMSNNMENLTGSHIESVENSAESSKKSNKIGYYSLVLNGIVLIVAVLTLVQPFSKEDELKQANESLRSELLQKDQQFEDQNRRITDLEMMISNLSIQEQLPPGTAQSEINNDNKEMKTSNE